MVDSRDPATHPSYNTGNEGWVYNDNVNSPSIVREILTWQEGDGIYSRLTANVSAKRLMARLTAFGMLESVESMHTYFGDRADGGKGYKLLWKRSATWEFLRASIPKI